MGTSFIFDPFAEGVAGLAKPDVSILSDEFFPEVRAMPQRNLAVELLPRHREGPPERAFSS